uniref:Uncharacterized protein n=1 Tax=Arundo donax TaxID=35708 RepID=A0A0A9D654_ARUDO
MLAKIHHHHHGLHVLFNFIDLVDDVLCTVSLLGNFLGRMLH